MTRDRAGLPAGAIQFVVTGANTANATMTRTVPAAPGKKHYIMGFDLSLGGATSNSLIQITLTGLVGGTQTFVREAVSGVTQNATSSVRFPAPIPTTGPNTAVVLTVPALGAGSAFANGNLYGYTL